MKVKVIEQVSQYYYTYTLGYFRCINRFRSGYCFFLKYEGKGARPFFLTRTSTFSELKLDVLSMFKNGSASC